MRFFLLLCLFSAAVCAQDFRATLSGQVADPSGSAVPGAMVKATNSYTGEVKDTKSNAQGFYTLPYLDPGNYNVEVTAPGFQLLRRESIILLVNDKVNLPLRLTVGEMTQQMTIVGQQEVLDSGSADRGLVFDPIKAQQLPLNGRQEYMLMALTPGVIFTQEQFGAGGYSGTRGWDVSNAYKINGARPGENVFLLNGAPISDNGGTWNLAPNVEAVQEFKVMTNTYDAQFGHFGGGAVNTTLKSGGNAYHGDVFDYFRNSVFDANNFANNIAGQPTPFHNQHQFGGVVGGPVRKNKDYFFASFEGWREVLPAPATDTVPTADMKTGTFASSGISVYDPLSSVPCVAPCTGHQYVRTQFPGNIIPQSRISPIAAKILSYYPSPTTGGLQNNFNAPNVKDQYYYNQPMGRWDHNFGDNDKLYGIGTFQHGQENRDGTGFGGPASNGNIQNQRTDTNFIAGYTHILSATAVFDARLSYGRFTQRAPGWGDPTFKGSSLGLNVPCAPTIDICAAPAIAFSTGGYTELFGNGNYIKNWYSYNQYDFVPGLTLTRGHHTLHIGMEYNYVARPSQSSGYASGLFTFSQGWTQHYSDQNSGSTDGSPIASLLLGYPFSGQVDNNSQIYITRPYVAGYIQDDWKVTPKLTVNVGLRYEVQFAWKERYNRAIRGFDYTDINPDSNAVVTNWAAIAASYNATNSSAAKYPYPAAPAALYGGVEFAGQNGTPRSVYQTDWRDVSPRLGVAYRLGTKTVLRAGAGVFYKSQGDNLSTQYGYSLTTPYNTSNDGGQTPAAGASFTGAYSLANPFPNGIGTPAGSSLGLLANIGNSITYLNPNYRTPRTYQYSFGFQHELPWAINAEVSYAGNKEIFVPVAFNQDNNPANLQQLQTSIADTSYLSHSVPNPFYGILPISSTLGASPTTTYGNLLRNYPLFTGLTQSYVQVGRYRSDQLQVKIEKRVRGGEKVGVFTWVLSYTFGKQMQADHRTDSWNVAEPLDYEIDDGTKIHELAFSGVYDVPFGKGKPYLHPGNRMLSLLASNWQIDYIFTYSSGFPVGWPALNNSCGVWQAANQNENSWFNNNKSCYATLAPNVLNPYQNRFSTIFNPAAPQLNAAVEKAIPISERFRFTLRGEAFNLSNTTIRPGPDTTFSDAQFGQLPKRQQNFPRVLQVAAKFYF